MGIISNNRVLQSQGYWFRMELLRIGLFLAAITLQISAVEIMEERASCSCGTLEVKLSGKKLTKKATAMQGTYYRMYDNTRRQYLWTSGKATISKGNTHWLMGPSTNNQHSTKGVIRARLGRNKNSCPYEKAFENAWYFKKSNGNGWNAARGGWSGAKITVTCKNSWG